jgi:arylmalonate decarboxylase
MKKRIGLIIPTTGTKVPVEAARMYPEIDFVARGLGLQSMTREGFDAVFDRIGELAAEFRTDRLDAMTLIGTSLSFYRGAVANTAVVDTIQRVTGLPCTSMSNAIIDGLRHVGAKRIAVATAYVEDVNQRLRTFLEGEGFDVGAIIGLGIEQSGTAWRISEAELVALGERAFEATPGADAILISCGGLRTLGVTVPLETATGVPVVSSMPAALWAAARLVGFDGRVSGMGHLLDP